jgi:hypothetical protein
MAKGPIIRWLRDTQVRGVVLVLLALIGYFVVYEVVFPPLWTLHSSQAMRPSLASPIPNQ